MKTSAIPKGRPDLWTLGLLKSNGRRTEMALPPWLKKHSETKSEKGEPEHKGKGSYEAQEKKEHGGKLPSKEAEMSESQHKGFVAKESGKASVRKTLKTMKGKK